MVEIAILAFVCFRINQTIVQHYVIYKIQYVAAFESHDGGRHDPRRLICGDSSIMNSVCAPRANLMKAQ